MVYVVDHCPPVETREDPTSSGHNRSDEAVPNAAKHVRTKMRDDSSEFSSTGTGYYPSQRASISLVLLHSPFSLPLVVFSLPAGTDVGF